ncbi:Histone acetyltransferase [Bertholletia excelsa]
MLDLKGACHSAACYRPIRPSDLEVLEKLHYDIFPIGNEAEFYHNVVIRPNGEADELVGFFTARVVPSKDSEITHWLVYILTLVVVESYRKLGTATSLFQKVITYASRIPTCGAVYPHVIYYNHAAIHLYQKMSFQCARWMPRFYFINGQHDDSYDLVMLIATYVCGSLELVAAKPRKNGGKKVPRWSNRSKEVRCLETQPQCNRIHTAEGTGCQFV